MIFVDSSVWIDYFNGRITRQTDMLDGLLARDTVLTGDLVLAEVLQGFRRERDFRLALKLLSGLPCADMLGREMAVRSAGNYRLLRKKGITVRKTIDVIIATFCGSHGFPLLHDDHDFDSMAQALGLKMI
ncbi:PIN domain nuclease [bacterium]|nr:PIN domain nuclease [bacterium]